MQEIDLPGMILAAYDENPHLTCEDIGEVFKEYGELRRLKGELIINTYEELFKELLNITREVYFMGGDDAKREEYRSTIAAAKTALGNIRRGRHRDQEPGAGSEIPDWFERSRRNDMGPSQEGDIDSRSEDVNGEECASDALPLQSW